MSSIAKSILLVDDNEKLLGALARTFKENSFDVHIAISSASHRILYSCGLCKVNLCQAPIFIAVLHLMFMYEAGSCVAVTSS